jgi:CheY-like chemotaxis protein
LQLETRAVFAQVDAMADDEPKRILIVDDDVTLMRVTREALESMLKCHVDASPKPEYAFELMLKRDYDLLIFDFQMPMIDGAMLFFLISKVYEAAQPPRTLPPLILVSGKAEEERAQDLLKEPRVRGLISKPFAINRLVQKVRECVPGIANA